MEKKKVLGRIKLTQLSKSELDKRAMNTIKGGSSCSCGGWRYWCNAVPTKS